jgi:membrane-associated phospholipid phosphatase
MDSRPSKVANASAAATLSARRAYSPTAVWWVAGWLLAIAGAFCIDRPLASHVYSSGIYAVVKASTVATIIKLPGTLRFIVVTIPLAWIGGRRLRSWRGGLLILAAAAIGGIFYSVLKWVVGRHRPIGNGVYNPNAFQLHFFEGGLRGLFVSLPDLSFPSGHACLAFATATALSMCIPRWAAAFYAIAAVVAVERVLEGAHYPSDVIAGAGVGVLAGLAAIKLLRMDASPSSAY